MNSIRTTREEALKKLYEGYGYSQYKMSKFEEYDLYVRNKSFLVSDHIITFTDTDGKLMALKPDVTLSIVKNSAESENGIRKVYYNENVYRVPKGALSFKEIMQAGLECIGEIDSYCVAEVLSLAAKSLAEISDDYVIDVSHMGIVSALADMLELSANGRKKLLSCIGEKNIHGIDALCFTEGVDVKNAEVLKKLLSMKGDCMTMLEALRGSACEKEAEELASTVMTVKSMGYKVNVDFSVTDDMKYYSGIVFKGFVKGIPTSVLSGGRYDNLMKKMGKKSGAIGFAVYLDCFAALDEYVVEYDADTIILYDDQTVVGDLLKRVSELSESGRVITRKTLSDDITYREIIDMRGDR